MKEHPKLFDVNRLQITIKAINNIIEINKLIPTLLIFGAYLRIMELDSFNLIIK